MTTVVSMKRYAVSTDELHNMTTSAIRQSEDTVFSGLPALIRQIVERRAWESYGHKTFAEYALCDTSSGLRVTNNQRLWILRCSMNVHDDHMAEWGEVLVEVEARVRAWAKANGKVVRSHEFDGNSLERLAKSVDGSVHEITYLPSRQKELDGNLIRLRRRDPKIYKRVVTGKMTLIEGRKAAGMSVNHDDPLRRAKSTFKLLNDEQKVSFVEWLKAEGHID